jgi:hypothetical protein
MAATEQQITDYLTDILYAQSVYMDKVGLKERLGEPEIFKYRLRNTILGFYVEILMNYFTQTDYENNNSLTTTEAKDIMSRINLMCDTNYNLAI